MDSKSCHWLISVIILINLIFANGQSPSKWRGPPDLPNRAGETGCALPDYIFLLENRDSK